MSEKHPSIFDVYPDANLMGIDPEMYGISKDSEPTSIVENNGEKEFLYSLGVIGFPLYSITKTGKIYDHRSKRWIPQPLDHRGYPIVQLFRKDGRRKVKLVHRLVAMLFLPIDNEELLNNPTLQVDHIDGDKTNPSVTNLRWCTAKQNRLYLNQRCPHLAAFTEEETVPKVCQELAKGKTVNEVAYEFKIHPTVIRSIKNKKRWLDIVSQYTFPKAKLHRPTYTDDVKHEICQLLSVGTDFYELAYKFGISVGMLYRIKQKKKWKEIADLYF